MSICAKCGADNRETASFCLSCGTSLKRPEQLPPPAMPFPDEQDNTTADPDPVSEGIPEENAKDNEPAAPSFVQQPLAEDDAAPTAEPPDPLTTSDEPGDTLELELFPTAPEAVIEPENELPELASDEARADPAEPVEQVEPISEPEESISDSELVEAAKESGHTSTLVMPPLEPGTLLDDRYEIVALLEEDPETLLYEARDHSRCPQCSYADSLPNDRYCANCGALINDETESPHVHLRALRVAGEAIIRLEEESKGLIERWLEANGQLFAVLALPTPDPEPEPMPFERGVRHIVGYNSDAGLQRELDEDALLALTLAPVFESQSRPSFGLYAVADGMGGHEGGEVASRMAIESLAEILTKELLLPELSGELIVPETPSAMFKEAIQAINIRIYDLQQKTGSDMGTTLTAAMVRDNVALIANVGDSRTYLWRDGQLNQLTTDHSLVAQLVAAEMIEPDEIYSHPDKSAIYRSLGHMPDVDADIFTQSLLPGDKLLLCCDGVWEMLRDEGIEEVLLLEADPQRACDEIVRRSNLAGGEDNISVVIVLFVELEGQLG
jgi:serine/threonine protein phosphatase PrpC